MTYFKEYEIKMMKSIKDSLKREFKMLRKNKKELPKMIKDCDQRAKEMIAHESDWHNTLSFGFKTYSVYLQKELIETEKKDIWNEIKTVMKIQRDAFVRWLKS